jgi:hypothetical protein
VLRIFQAFILLSPGFLFATPYTGTVRAADQFIPGATVTAHQGGAKVVAYTNENGRYSLDLLPGVWDIEIEMFGFAPKHDQVTIGSEPTARDWTLEVPRFGAKPPAPAATPQPPKPGATTASTPSSTQPQPAGQGRSGRGGFQRGGGGRGFPQGAAGGRGGAPQQQPGFQNMAVTATEGSQAQAIDEPPPDLAGADTSDLTVIGSMSGGVAAAADEQARRDRVAGRGGPGGGPMMADSAGLMTLNGPGADPFGMGGFGAAGANNGFGLDNGGGLGPGPGGRGGPAGAGGGGRGGAGGGGGGGRGGGGGGGRGGRGPANNRRGPYNGQFASFGNRRRQQPAYQGSIAVTATNSALNAAPFSLNGQSQPKPSSSSETITGNIGGPLRIPKLVTNDKWFVYLNFTGNINQGGATSVGTVPTALERSGDFSQSMISGTPVTVFDPLNHTPFPNNLIPVSRFDGAALALLTYFPNPTYSGITQNYSISTQSPSHRYSLGVRLNGSVTTKDRLNFNEQYSRNNSTNEQVFGFTDTTSGYGLSASAGWTHSFKPRFNNSATLTFSRNISKAAPYFAYKENVAGNLGIVGPDESPIDYGPPNLSFTNFTGLSDGSASVNRSQTTNFTDTVTYVIQRKHNFTFGYGFRKMQQNTLSYANSRGSLSFSGLVTSQLDSQGQPVSGTGYDFADFLLGNPQTSSLRTGNSNNYFRGWATNGSVTDDWRVNRGFTLNLGLRYEYFAPYTELFGHLANLDVNSTLTAVARVTPGSTGPFSGPLPSSLLRPDTNNFSPRLGFAWRPSQKHSRVIRGGYSIFFSGLAYSQIAARMAAQPPFANVLSLSTNLADPLTIQNGFPSQPPSLITNTYAVDPNYKPAYAQTWTVAIQQSLPHSLVMELEYVGTKGTGLEVLEAPNQAPPGSSPAAGQQNLPIPNASSFTYITDHANSIFHAGQVRLTRRMTRGMSAVALYTFSKSIDDASSFSGGGGGTLVQNPFDLSAERALSTTDQRHRLNLTYLLSSPVGVHGLWRNGGWKTRLLTGWMLNGTFTANSGVPLTAYVSGSLANARGTATLGSSRAEATGLSIYGTGNAFFNPAAFTLPPDGEYGNAGRDTIPGPALISLNGSLNRAWRFGDSRRQLQLRINANNALNHVQITSFGTTVNSRNYGLATAASATRTVSLLVRFSF